MPDPFISPKDVVDYLGRGNTADPGLLIATDAACDICRTLAEQQFNRGTTVYTLDGTGTDAILLPDLPVNSAGTVIINGGTVTDYMLSSNGVLFRGTVGGYDYGRYYDGYFLPRIWPLGRQNIKVTADHGYADIDIPRDVRMVALSIATRLVVQNVASEETIGAVAIKYATAAGDLTAAEQAILRKYRPTR